GAATQSWLTGLEVAGLLMLVMAGLWLALGGVEPATASSVRTAASAPASGAPGMAAFGLAMVFVLLTFGGWNEAAYLSAELQGEHRSMVRALVGSIVLITVLYLGVVWACWRGLGMAGMAGSGAVAADL